MGDKLALFECLDLCSRENIPFTALPEWVIRAWCEVGAHWYRAHVEMIEEYVEKWVRLARSKGEVAANRLPFPVPPTLEEIAGIRRGRKKPDPWRHGGNDNASARDHCIAAFVERLRQYALNEREAGRNAEWNGIGILNRRGELTKKFQDAVAREFDVGTGWGNSRARTVTRAIARARKSDEARNPLQQRFKDK